MSKRSVAATLICLLVSVSMAGAEQLTIDRLFEAPALSGPTPRGVRIAPDASRVTFLRGSADDPYRLDLWEFSLADGTTRMLVDSRALVPEPAELSEEEKARRERQRLSHVRGIVGYRFAADSRTLLFPLAGDLYLYDLAAEPSRAGRRLTETLPFETDAKFSPDGRFVSFVRDQDLYCIEIATGKEARLTSDGGGVIRNGMAEFVAQEEMKRDTGYWWAPDGSAVAFARVDETPVEVLRRYDIGAGQIRVVEQRYPRAGTPNARVTLGVVPATGGDPRWLDLGDDPDVYVARVDWFPDGRHLAVQRQSRDQKRLDLLKVDTKTGESTVLLTETAGTWINLNDDLVFLDDGKRFVWASERTGFLHLYLYDTDGALIRPLTAGDWMVADGRRRPGVLGVDEESGHVYFRATKDSPLERHLYRTSLTTDDPTNVTRITQRAGVHAIAMSDDASLYIDTFSSPDTPPQVSIHRADGTRIAWLEENRLDEDHPYHPYVAARATREFGSLQAEDGQTLHYEVYKPAEFDPERKHPVLFKVYGGPGGQGVTKSWNTRTSAYWLHFLTQQGFVVFQLDNRGTGSRGKAFDDPIHRQLGDIEVRDQLVGLRWLKKQPFVDPDRIAAFGWSYGGYMTLMMLAKAPGEFAAGVSGAPVTEWTMYDTHYTERYLGQPATNAEGYRASDVYPYIETLVDPILVMHGMADDNVLFTNATKLFKSLQDLGRSFDIMVYPGSRHLLLSESATGAHGYRTITRYLERELKD